MPLDKLMPIEPDPPMIQWTYKPWLAGCAFHALEPPDAPTLAIRVNVKPVSALLDSGSTVTLAQPSILGQGPRKTGTLLVSCMYGDDREVPVAQVRVSTTAREWPFRVRLIPGLPVPLLLGQDWPGFPMTTLPQPTNNR